MNGGLQRRGGDEESERFSWATRRIGNIMGVLEMGIVRMISRFSWRAFFFLTPLVIYLMWRYIGATPRSVTRVLFCSENAQEAVVKFIKYGYVGPVLVLVVLHLAVHRQWLPGRRAHEKEVATIKEARGTDKKDLICFAVGVTVCLIVEVLNNLICGYW